MRAREDIVRALRCSATVHETVDCTGCPYLLEDKDEDGVHIQDCNAGAIFRDAIEMLEQDKRTISALIKDRKYYMEKYEELKNQVPLYDYVLPEEGAEDDES